MCAPETRLPMLNIPTVRRRRSRVAYLEEEATATRDTVLALPSPEETNRTTNAAAPLKKSNRFTGRPLAAGVHVMCRWRDGNYHLAQIIERRKVDSGGKSQFEYYVHYPEFDRRLDEWATPEKFDLDASEKSVEQKVKAQVTGAKRARTSSRRVKEAHSEDGGDLALDPASLREHEKCTKVKNVAFIEIGRHKIETWYYSPLPPEFHNSRELYLCEFCLSFMKSREQLERHTRKCDLKHPPGNEIYRNGKLSMFEVDGRKNKVYCQNLCYMAKLFIDHKALCDEVHYFLFYILCECDDNGCHMVAYFSKEKKSEHSCNLACILTLPPYQRKGYGKFLITFSYELSKKEGKAGTPEKPLSDLGKLSYKGYWTRALVEILKKQDCEVSVRELSEKTAILPYDVFCTLKELNLIQCNSEGTQYICTDHKVLDSHLKAAVPGGPTVDASKLMWTPYKELEQEQEQEQEQEPELELALVELS